MFVALARTLMLINSCLNPFIYASTLPAFKKVATGYIMCKFESIVEGLKEIRTPRMGIRCYVTNTTSPDGEDPNLQIT